MKTNYVIQISFAHPDGYWWEAGSDYEEFIDRYAAYTDEHTIKFTFPEKPKFFEALSYLKKQGLRYVRYYDFELEPDELDSYPALRLGLMPLHAMDEPFLSSVKFFVKSFVKDGQEIIKDVETGQIIVSARVQEILERMTKGVEWTPQPISAGQKWFWMVPQQLPEPIFIPNPYSITRYDRSNIPDVYEVDFDGRRVASDANVAFLAEVGVAMNYQSQTPTEIIKTDPEAIATGKIINALKSIGVKDILEYSFPLLTSDHPLSHKKQKMESKPQ
ncbi:MAG TPA: hypothetical protein DDW76_26350 [Cyanobacteria bacterium UBA11369]|nr:hypothetical protein [Cyanobacteria bacterium UBA11371]HBE18385.1 hypothetical protein [Cyanobacteria bacterium UBA11367]HBE36737.1 hypothetical protein [Cyanobacteria bacterium UBA11368]HBE52195.1 hypothetical protein [Cyanobacteria bacterium UBA11369]